MTLDFNTCTHKWNLWILKLYHSIFSGPVHKARWKSPVWKNLTDLTSASSNTFRINCSADCEPYLARHQSRTSLIPFWLNVSKSSRSGSRAEELVTTTDYQPWPLNKMFKNNDFSSVYWFFRHLSFLKQALFHSHNCNPWADSLAPVRGRTCGWLFLDIIWLNCV